MRRDAQSREYARRERAEAPYVAEQQKRVRCLHRALRWDMPIREVKRIVKKRFPGIKWTVHRWKETGGFTVALNLPMPVRWRRGWPMFWVLRVLPRNWKSRIGWLASDRKRIREEQEQRSGNPKGRPKNI